MAPPKRVTRRIADKLALDPKTVRRALDAADMTEAECEIDFEEALRIVRNWADTDRVIGHAANDRGDGGNRTNSAYSDAKAQSELHRARKLELQNAKLEGSLVDRQAATDTGVQVLAEVRTAFLSLSIRIASKLIGKSEREITAVIDAEVRDILSGLADDAKFFDKLALS